MTGVNYLTRSDGAIGINVGGWYVSTTGELLSTVLGSCVAVCLYDPIERIGGMNHILLPGEYNMQKMTDAARYGVNAMELLINGLMKKGASRKMLQAKIFGGAAVLSTVSDMYGMGARNIAFVQKFLDAESIPLLSSDVGGEKARKIFFNTGTGEVLLKRIEIMQQRKISIAEERNCQIFASRLPQHKSDIELFELRPLDKNEDS